MDDQAELPAPEVTQAQRASAVYRHPKRLEIEALLTRKTPDWIAAWLRDEYPADKDPRNERLQLSPRSIRKYRDRFLPEHRPGIDVLPSVIEDLIGRTPPPAPRHELDRLDALMAVTNYNLGVAMKMDQELEMLQPLTLQAQQQALDATMRAIDAKSKLGVPGYEAAATQQKVQISSTSQNVNVDLHGRVDPRTGEPVPIDPQRVDVMREVLKLGPDAVMDFVAAARERADGTVDGEATEEPDG